MQALGSTGGQWRGLEVLGRVRLHKRGLIGSARRHSGGLKVKWGASSRRSCPSAFQPGRALRRRICLGMPCGSSHHWGGLYPGGGGACWHGRAEERPEGGLPAVRVPSDRAAAPYLRRGRPLRSRRDRRAAVDFAGGGGWGVRRRRRCLSDGRGRHGGASRGGRGAALDGDPRPARSAVGRRLDPARGGGGRVRRLLAGLVLLARCVCDPRCAKVSGSVSAIHPTAGSSCRGRYSHFGPTGASLHQIG